VNALAPVYESLRRGDWERARAQCRDLLAQGPDYAPAHHAAGLSRCGEGAFDLAVVDLERACAAAGAPTHYSTDLAIVYARLGRWHDSVRVLAPALRELDGRSLSIYLAASVESGQPAEAVHAVRELDPAALQSDAGVLAEYGRALHAAGHADAAERALLACLAADAANVRGREALAILYQKSGRIEKALEHWTACAALQPADGHARLRLAVALAEAGRLRASRAARAADVQSGLSPAAHATALYLMLFDEAETAATIQAACRDAFEPAGQAGARARPRASVRSAARPGGRLRVGYVSGDFTQPPASHFLSPFLAAHDRDAVDLFLYNTSPRPGAAPPAYRHPQDRWRDVARASDEEILTTLRADDLDVLVDLSGHFPGNRLRVFARRPVAVQATFPNYPCTTGCPEIDYFFTDRWTSPAGSDVEYSETLQRLPSGYLKYAPPLRSPGVAPLPALRNGYVTFGVIQRLLKISSTMWDCFAEVLQRTPGSRLLLHYGDPALDRPGSDLSRFLRRQLEARDVDPARLTLAGRRPLREHLDLLGGVDIGLDTFPYGGQTTTSECLWMGVPVVARAGATHVGRVSAGLLQRAGLPAFVATCPRSYVEAAAAAASDVDALADCRSQLRPRVVGAGLTDGRTLAREMERAFREWTAG
jgi:predicted O-linked N-acetylglucosamine transferase (SPINDLY family)